MCGYIEYLTATYGDYMKLPPKEKQIPHNCTAYWLD
jgi:lipopolysaccharide cholinephosphotransferase